MNVIAYCRVSTAEQSDSGVSLDAQQAKMRAYADLYNLTIVETIIDAESAKIAEPGRPPTCPESLAGRESRWLADRQIGQIDQERGRLARPDRRLFRRTRRQATFLGQRFHRHPDGRRPAGFERFDYRRPMGAGDDRRKNERGPSAQDQQPPARGQSPLRLRSGPGWNHAGREPGRTADPRLHAQPAGGRLHVAADRGRIDRPPNSHQGKETPMDAHRRSLHSRKSGLNLVEELQQAILNSGETEYRVAKESGVAQPILNRFLRGERGISLETAAKVCQYLGLAPGPHPPLNRSGRVKRAGVKNLARAKCRFLGA